MATLTRRADFKAVARGVRVSSEAFTLQALRRDEATQHSGKDGARVGLTVTKKVGNAVVRNRIKRRFRALCHQMRRAFQPRTDYVILARHAALRAPFDHLERELGGALHKAAARLDAAPAGARSRRR